MTRLAALSILALTSTLLFACGDPSSATGCGDNVCSVGESPASCPEDCEKPDAGVTCGNTKCDAGETHSTCPADCPAVCGDTKCEGSETQSTCPVDCNAVLKIDNRSTSVFYYVFIWPCGQSNDFLNRLNGTLPNGYYVRYDQMTPGCWNLEARTSGYARTVSMPNVTLTGGQQTTWTIQN